MINEIQTILKDNITTSESNAKRFFKTKPGFYSQHDCFIGVTVPNLRKIAASYNNIDLNVIQKLLESKINEERLLGLIILVNQYKKALDNQKDLIYKFYIKNLQHINNWNLVDASAHLIMGAHLFNKDKTILTELANSDNLWERRVAIVSTWYFIKNSDLDYTFELAAKLLSDKEDLMHKATGWMLREAGKKDKQKLIAFLNDHSKTMPRTMLRYAIEKFPEEERMFYLKR